MQFGALGDIHGAFDAARSIVARHPEVPFWLCVGDLATDPSASPGAGGRYESVGAPVYWIHGNNDDFDAIAAGDLPPDLHHLPNGTAITVGGLRVAGLGGTFAPTWYETRAAALPHPKKSTAKATALADPSTGSGSSRAKARDDKRRHFVREEVDACARLRGVDVFLSHEAARPFRPFAGRPSTGLRAGPSTGLRTGGPDAGKSQINEVLAAMQPRLHLFGHHHRFSDETREGVRSVGLDLVTRSYLLIDAAALDLQLKQT
jgi:predicted phosphodiesterase